MKKREINYTQMSEQAITQLSKGAFLNLKKGEEINTMTIAWGMIGYIWNGPIFQVLVRESRHSYEMIEGSDCFTVSIPLDDHMKEQLKYCGTKSGRDVNKFDECNITAVPGEKVDCPIVGECELHYECRIVGKQELKAEDILPSIREKKYSNNDYHTMYYGEIVSCYVIEND